MATKAERDAAKAAAERDAKLTTRGNHKVHVLRALYIGNRVVLLEIEQTVNIVCRERDEAGRVLASSDNAARKTHWISVNFEDIRKNAVKLGIARLILVNYNAITPSLLSVFVDCWMTINITPFLEGDEYEIDDQKLNRKGDGQIIVPVSANISDDAIAFARDTIVAERKRK